MTPDRLRALAREAAKAQHDHRHVFCPLGDDDDYSLTCIRCDAKQSEVIEHAQDFNTCPHPDCVLVRSDASVSEGRTEPPEQPMSTPGEVHSPESSAWWVCFRCWKAYYVPTTGHFGDCPDCHKPTQRWPADPNQTLRLIEYRRPSRLASVPAVSEGRTEPAPTPRCTLLYHIWPYRDDIACQCGDKRLAAVSEGRTQEPKSILVDRDANLRVEMRAYLDTLAIHGNNIGDIRCSLFVPWDSAWNGWVREDTADRERPGPIAEGTLSPAEKEMK